MKYLVTGGAGFIGSHLTDSLIHAGHEVLILDDFSTGRNENIASLEDSDQLQVICADVTEEKITRECVARVDRVFHLASAVGVQLIIDQPVKTIKTIVEGTSVVLSACARYRRPILVTSTSEVYGKSNKTLFSETDDSVIGPPMFRRWSYAAAKSLDEFMTLAHVHYSGLPATVVRLFNTVGPRQTGQYGMVIPRFVKQALLGEPIVVYGDGKQTRCFCHVRDAVWALGKLMETPKARGELFNVGSDHEISINQLAETIRRVTNSKSEIHHISYAEAYESGFEDMARRVPNLAKIGELIGYRPRHALEDTLRDVVADLRSQLSLEPDSDQPAD